VAGTVLRWPPMPAWWLLRWLGRGSIWPARCLVPGCCEMAGLLPW
jgi:hypothetical protein